MFVCVSVCVRESVSVYVCVCVCGCLSVASAIVKRPVLPLNVSGRRTLHKIPLLSLVVLLITLKSRLNSLPRTESVSPGPLSFFGENE